MKLVCALLGLAFGATAMAQTQWEMASPWGLQNGDIWLSGRATDVFEIRPGEVLVSTDAAGVWWVQRNLTVSLSQAWDSTSITSLAPNTAFPGHFYAGGVQSGRMGGGALYRTKHGDNRPMLAQWDKLTLPPRTGTINRILTLSNPPRILLATDSGLLWSPIEASGVMRWQEAEGSNGRAFYDVEKGPGDDIVLGVRIRRDGPTMMFGTWNEVPNSKGRIQVRLQPSTLVGTDQMPVNTNIMSTMSVASCATQPSVMYAICSNPAGAMSTFYRSDDAGRTWNPRPAWLNDQRTERLWSPNHMGRQGNDRNNCIAVDPNDPNTVVIGWVKGPYISRDGGNQFRLPAGYAHDDHATVTFFGNRLYSCNDGGVISTTNLGETFDYTVNRRLPIHQFYPSAFDVDGAVTTTMGGGLQDNNVIYTTWTGSNVGPWKFTEAPNYDGGSFMVVGNGMVWCDGGGLYKYAPRTTSGIGAQTEVSPSGAPAETLATDDKLYITSPRTYRITRPVVRQNGYSLVALAFFEGQSRSSAHTAQVFGLVAPRSGAPIWEPLARVVIPANQSVACLASYDGSVIYVGLGGKGGMLKVDVATRSAIPQTGLPDDNNYIITEIVAPSPNDVFCIRNEARTLGQGSVYALSRGDAWTQLSGLPNQSLSGLAAESPQVVFVATESTVYKSENNRGRWDDISAGLPRLPRPTGIRVVTIGDRKWLYMSTYGWSVWRRPL